VTLSGTAGRPPSTNSDKYIATANHPSVAETLARFLPLIDWANVVSKNAVTATIVGFLSRKGSRRNLRAITEEVADGMKLAECEFHRGGGHKKIMQLPPMPISSGWKTDRQSDFGVHILGIAASDHEVYLHAFDLGYSRSIMPRKDLQLP